MMQRVAIFAVALLAAVGSYAATRAVRSEPAVDPATQALLDWLDVAADQRREMYDRDPTFGTELRQLREQLRTRRMALAAALEDPQSSDELITNRAEDVIAASNALERRVIKYLLTVRRHLTPEQRRRLFGLCAEGVRQGPGWRWRIGPGGEGMGRPGRYGRGRMQGGMGPGRGVPLMGPDNE